MKKLTRKKSPKLTPGTRKEIKEMFDSGNNKPKDIANYIGCSIHQVNAVIYGKVKMTNTVRSDKGSRRSEESEKKNDDTKNKACGERSRTEDTSLIEMLQTSLHEAVKDLKKRTYAPDVKLSLIQKASSLLKNLESLELQSHMKGLTAGLLMRIMLRLQPELTIEEIKKIYSEELEKLKSNSEG